MKAGSVHGGGAVLASISERLGRRGQYGPEAYPLGIATVNGLVGIYSAMVMFPSSSASDSS